MHFTLPIHFYVLAALPQKLSHSGQNTNEPHQEQQSVSWGPGGSAPGRDSLQTHNPMLHTAQSFRELHLLQIICSWHRFHLLRSQPGLACCR